MPQRPQEWLVYAGLTLFTVWPAVHMALVERYGLSPWKAAGWGMYSAPRFAELGMEVYGRADAGQELEKLGAPPPEVRATASEFLERRRWLGRLASARRFADAVLAHRPDWHEVRVIVMRPALDPTTGMVVWQSSSEEYTRR